MKPILQLPLERLWRDDARVDAVRGRRLARDDVRELLRRGPVQFVIANVGHEPRWIPLNECFDFWKRDAAAHVADSDRFSLDEFPASLAYVASEWLEANSSPIVVLEAHH